MNLNRLIYRQSIFFFAFIAISAVFGFWPGYLSKISGKDLLVHIHGALLSLWLAMLITQAYLIRTNRRAIHKQLGKLSYVLAPLILLSIATIRHHAMARSDDPFGESQMALVFFNAIGQPVTFALTYGLAIFNRRDPATHARFMLCTLIPAAGPIFNRVMTFYVSDGIVWAPFTRTVVVVSLIGLSLWDWKANRRLNVFPIVLGVVLGLIVANSLLAGSELKMSFARWYLSLPLS